MTETIFNDPIRDDVYRKNITRPFVAVAGTITIKLEGVVLEPVAQTALVDLVELREVLPWGIASTWQGGIPGQNTNVSIPVGSTVGVSIGAANRIDVQGELLGLESSPTDATLSTRHLHVHGPGSLFQVGTAGCPFQGLFLLVLDDDVQTDGHDVNSLLVDDHGVVDLHGRKTTSWLRLQQTAQPYSTLPIVLESMPVGWQTGDQIVIAASDRDFNHAETRTIQGIAPGAGGTALVTLDAPLVYLHCGVRQTVQAPTRTFVLDQRAEVGLLTHNVKVLSVPRSTMSVPRLGGHIMIRAVGVDLAEAGIGRFSCVELVGLGREKQRGRYPMHWHMLLGAGMGQYIKDSSIRNSHLRAIVVHGTDSVLVEGNVVHEHLGHGIFLEDGSEQFNVFRNNLVLGSRRPLPGKGVLPSDEGPLMTFQNRSPASFWIANPHNTFVGNVAAGGQGVGYWFALAGARMGDSSSNVAAQVFFFHRPAPYDQTLLQFDDNSCHSTWIGLDVHDGIGTDASKPATFEAIRTNVTWRPSAGKETLRRFSAYSCNVGIYTGDGGTSIEFNDAVIADSSRALAFASHDIAKNSLIVRDSGNGLWTGLPAEYVNSPAMALLMYDGAARIEAVHLAGFAPPTTTPMPNTPPGFYSAFWGVGAARRRTDVKMSGITCSVALTGGVFTVPYVGWQDFADPNSPPNLIDTHYTNPSAWAFSIDNQDLSLGRMAGVTAATVVGNHPMMLVAPGIIEQPVPNAGFGIGSNTRVAWSSPYRFAFLRIICEGISGTPPEGLEPPTAESFQLRYVRERLVGNAWQPAPAYTDAWRTLWHKQMAVIVDPDPIQGPTNGIRYRMGWPHPLWTNALLPTTELRLGEMQVGESVLIGLEGYVMSPLPLVQLARTLNSDRNDTVASWYHLTPVTGGMTALMAQPDTSYYVDSVAGIIWLRIVASPAASGPNLKAISLNADGLGQIVRLWRDESQ